MLNQALCNATLLVQPRTHHYTRVLLKYTQGGRSIIVSPPLSPAPLSATRCLFFLLLGNLHTPAALWVKVVQRAEALVSPTTLDCVVPRPARSLRAIAPLIEPRKRGED